MDREKKVVVFCSSSYSIPQKFNDVAREVVRLLCGRGYGVVSGGAVKGTMGVVADEVVRCGGTHTGVIPRFMEQYLYPQLDTLIWTETMSERKELMRKGTCAAIALPGGIGTLDELVETHVLAKLGKYSGKVIALNVDGFYDPLKALLDHYVDTGMLNPSDRDLLLFPETVKELAAILDSQN